MKLSKWGLAGAVGLPVAGIIFLFTLNNSIPVAIQNVIWSPLLLVMKIPSMQGICGGGFDSPGLGCAILLMAGFIALIYGGIGFIAGSLLEKVFRR